MSLPSVKTTSVVCATTYGDINLILRSCWTLTYGPIFSLKDICMPRIMKKWAGLIPHKTFSHITKASLSRISKISEFSLKSHKIAGFSHRNSCRLSKQSRKGWSRCRLMNLTRLLTTKRRNIATNTKRKCYTSKSNRSKKLPKCPNTSKNTQKMLPSSLPKKWKSRSLLSWSLRRCKKK